MKRSKRSKGTFGTEFTVGNVLQIFLVLIGVFLITGLIISASGGIQGMLQKLCDAVPQLCQSSGTDYEYMISKRSTCYLTCAMNSVILGEQQDCSQCSEASSPVTGKATASVPLTPSTKVGCQGAQGGTLECKVTDFYLPENLGGLFNDPKEHIEGFGDPSFLVYFQKFPKGEDASWASYEAWWQGIGEAVIWAIPAIGGIKAIGKPISKGVEMAKLAKSPRKAAKALYDYGKRKISVLGEKKIATEAGEETLESLALRRGWKDIDEFFDENVFAVEKASLKRGIGSLFRRIYRERINRKMFKYFAEKGYNAKYLVSRLVQPKEMVDDFYVYGGEFADEIILSLNVRTQWDKVTKKLEEVFGDMLKNYGNKDATIFKNVDVYRFFDDAFQKEIFPNIFKGVSNDVAKRVMTYAGITSLGAYVGKRFECEEQKQITKPKSIVIQRPLRCKEGEYDEYPLEQNFEGGTSLAGTPFATIPGAIALNKWENLNKPVPFYLASPCRTDLIIKRRPQKCSYYSFERESGEVQCTDLEILKPDEKYKYPSCGFGKSEYNHVNSYYEIVKKLYLTQNKQLFEEYEQPLGEGTIRTIKAYVPILIKDDGTTPHIELKFSHRATENYGGGRDMTFTYYNYSFEGKNLGLLECFFAITPQWDNVFKIEIFREPEYYKNFVKSGSISGIDYDIVEHEWGTSYLGYQPSCIPPEKCDFIDVYEYIGPDRFFYCAPTDSYLPPRLKGSFYQPDRVSQEEFYDYCSHDSLKDAYYCKNTDLNRELKIKLIGDTDSIFYKEIIEIEKKGSDNVMFDDLDVSGNMNGKWNKFYLDIRRGDDYSFAFADYDEDGVADYIQSENCIVDGIEVSPDKNSFEKYTESMKNNFCYTKTDTWRVVASKGLMVVTWIGEAALAISSAPAASVTIPLAQGVMAYTSTKLGGPTHWPDH